MKRERLEDLGRLRVLLENIRELEIFIRIPSRLRASDFHEWFNEQTNEFKLHFMEQLPYDIQELSSRLDECIVISRGHDDE